MVLNVVGSSPTGHPSFDDKLFSSLTDGLIDFFIISKKAGAYASAFLVITTGHSSILSYIDFHHESSSLSHLANHEGHGDRYIGSLFRVDEPVPDDSVTRRVPPKRAQSTMSLA